MFWHFCLSSANIPGSSPFTQGTAEWSYTSYIIPYTLMFYRPYWSFQAYSSNSESMADNSICKSQITQRLGFFNECTDQLKKMQILFQISFYGKNGRLHFVDKLLWVARTSTLYTLSWLISEMYFSFLSRKNFVKLNSLSYVSGKCRLISWKFFFQCDLSIVLNPA